MPAISMSKTSRIGLLAAATALLASCGGGGGNPIQAADQFPGTGSPLFGEAADTLLMTDVYEGFRDGQTEYEATRCSHDQCTYESSVTVTVQSALEAREVRSSSCSDRFVRLVNGVEIRRSLFEAAAGNAVRYGADLDNVWFQAGFNNWTNDLPPRAQRTGFGIVVGQASGHPPETTARYNGAWTHIYDGRGPFYGAAVLDYRFTSTGGEIDAFFYDDEDEEELISGSAFQGVAVNRLGKFRHGVGGQDSAKIDGSFFGGAADEVGGIVEWVAQGGGLVLGAFGAELQ